MTDNDKTASLPFAPLMPTGNGVTDLEIARELAAVSDGARSEQPPIDDAAGGPQAEGGDVPVDDGRPLLSE